MLGSVPDLQHTIKPGLRVKAKAGTGTLFVFNDIGPWGINASDVAAALAELADAAELRVHINSFGGDAFEGVAIFNLIRAFDGPITTQVDGLAASAASVIAMAGQNRLMNKASQLMIHEARGGAWGTASLLRLTANNIEQINTEIANIYQSVAGGDLADWVAAMDPETRYSADEAISAGLATGTVDTAGDEDDPDEGLSTARVAERSIMRSYIEAASAPPKGLKLATGGGSKPGKEIKITLGKPSSDRLTRFIRNESPGPITWAEVMKENVKSLQESADEGNPFAGIYEKES